VSIRATLLILLAACLGTALVAQEPAVVTQYARPIEPPAAPLPSEDASASVTKFSFLAYGDSRGIAATDGHVLNAEHSRLMDAMIATIDQRTRTPFPVRFVVQSGDAALRGANYQQWDVSFSPIIERLTRQAGMPYFFAVGNHDVTSVPLAADPAREPGLRNALSAMSKLIPPDGSPRRLTGYPTYSFGYGNVFVVALDSNIAGDAAQIAWVAGRLERLDRSRYRHVIAVFHHPPFSSGPHGGATIEPAAAVLRDRYLPLFRQHHVRMIITGHEHLFEHWIERYSSNGVAYRMDQMVSGGGGAPTYGYRGEPDLSGYLLKHADEKVALEHVVKPGATALDNPHHFLIIQVDGDRLSLEVVGSPAPFAPYNGRSRIELVDRVS
jgi:acid phosphatase type 7